MSSVFNKGKETKPVSTPSRDFDPTMYKFGGQDLLSLDPTLQKAINDAGLDRRFMNAVNFRKQGGHHNYWRALNVMSDLGLGQGTFGSTPEGTIIRGDLVLGVRDKRVSKLHAEALAEARARLSGEQIQKSEAQKLRDHARNIGMGAQASVHEGFEDDSKTKKGAYKEVDSE